MEWISNLTQQPDEPGKYVVRTTTRMGNSNTFECNWTGKNWSCTNQIVSYWLKE